LIRAVSASGYQLIQLANGAFSIHANAYGEKMHPGLGPAAEAELLYVLQLKIRDRMQRHAGDFVVWDVGLGAAANALTLLRLTRDLSCPLRLVSFDDTSSPLEFALTHAEKLGYLNGYEIFVKELLRTRCIEFADGARTVRWEFNLGDFPAWCAQALERRAPARRVSDQQSQRAEAVPGAPHAIIFDAFSPAKNPGMWTLPLFENLFRRLDPKRPCNLTTYSRSTMLRVTLLLAGFFVGRGVATGLKEETTVAANTLALIDAPLDCRWLERARRSDSAEPLLEPLYRRAPLSPATWEKLRAHPQFQP
jgi:hypothetical protein